MTKCLFISECEIIPNTFSLKSANINENLNLILQFFVKIPLLSKNSFHH